MKPAARNVIVVVAVGMIVAIAAAIVVPSVARAAAGRSGAAKSPIAVVTPVRDLLAHGSDEFLWVADVGMSTSSETPGVNTTVRFRTAGDMRWQVAGEIAARPTLLASRGSELLIVLDDGSWKIANESGIRSGNDLPGGYDVIALAGQGDGIWAVGAADPSRALAATSTSTTSSASGPSTPTPPPAGLMLFVLRSGAWKEAGPLPVKIKSAGEVAAISLEVFDDRLTLAIVGPERAARVFTRGVDDRWDGGVEAGTLNADARMKLLNLRGRPALWLADPKSAGTLSFRNDRWQPPIKLAESDKLASYDRRALAYALGQLRLIASDPQGRLAEQLYKLDGTLQGQATEAVTVMTDAERRISKTIQLVVIAMLVIWMLGALRQRPHLQEAIARAPTLHLAPFGRRFIGGMIDLAPLFVACLFAGFAVERDPQSVAAGTINYKSPEFAWITAGLGVYFLHTTLMEVFLARSIGKFITNTRVATLDGSRPGPAALLGRNVMRVVDVVLLFVPLLSVFSPLRQRVGDMSAGTIVVMNLPDPGEPITLETKDETPAEPPAASP
jgi:uncharacterized RDD family membrane protein YckC